MFDIGRLEILFKRAGSLPPLPIVVTKLVDAIDGQTASATDLEKIITSDPILVAEIMRAVGTTPLRVTTEISSLRQAIILLGHRAIRSIALGFAIRSLSKLGSRSNRFNAEEFAEHSSQVATLTRYLYARLCPTNPKAPEWTAEELFAAALLHDLGFALLAHVEPDSYDRVSAIAEALEITLDEAFRKCYGSEIGRLGAAACAAWKLPEVFAVTQENFQSPAFEPKHLKALSCLCLANHLVCSQGQQKPPQLPEYVRDVVKLTDEEIEAVMGVLHGEAQPSPRPELVGLA